MNNIEFRCIEIKDQYTHPFDSGKRWYKMTEFKWVIAVLAILVLLCGCATPRAFLQLQCLNSPTQVIEGPVIIEEDKVIYYDRKGKLTKEMATTCGIK